MIRRFNACLVSTAAVLCAMTARADVRLPAIFSDHMVLQRGVAAPVWGSADPGEEVKVTLGGADLPGAQPKSAVAGTDGRWKLKLGALKGGGVTTLTVQGKNTLTVSDVLIGEVWLCSGQSNMAMAVRGCNDFPKEQAEAQHPQIRMFTVTSGPAASPQDDCRGSWVVCSPDTVAGFSATAYFFGREIHRSLGVPVGLVHSSVGGTPIEAWTSWDAQKDLTPLKSPIFDNWTKRQAAWDPAKAVEAYETRLAAYRDAAAKAKEAEKPAPQRPAKPVEPHLDSHYPATLYNGKINPLVPYAIRGALWYQGENNASPTGGPLYHLQLTTLIRDWRRRWSAEFPFGFVQLPDFHAPQKEPVENTGWTLVREGMLQTLSTPRTGMAVTLGLGEANNIHPKNKQEVGLRLAMWALADVYGKKGIASSGPLPVGHEVSGSAIVVRFKHADGGLQAPGGSLRGFAIAAADKRWMRADARIDGDRVVVSSPDVPNPVAVRYAWADTPDCNLKNAAGLPASPFRTDDW